MVLSKVCVYGVSVCVFAQSGSRWARYVAGDEEGPSAVRSDPGRVKVESKSSQSRVRVESESSRDETARQLFEKLCLRLLCLCLCACACVIGIDQKASELGRSIELQDEAWVRNATATEAVSRTRSPPRDARGSDARGSDARGSRHDRGGFYDIPVPGKEARPVYRPDKVVGQSFFFPFSCQIHFFVFFFSLSPSPAQEPVKPAVSSSFLSRFYGYKRTTPLTLTI